MHPGYRTQSSILHPHCRKLELWTKRVAAAAQSPCCFAVLMATATRLWMRGSSGAHWGGLYAPAPGLAPVHCTGGQEAGTGQPNTQIWRVTPDGEEFRCCWHLRARGNLQPFLPHPQAHLCDVTRTCSMKTVKTVTSRRYLNLLLYHIIIWSHIV